MYSFNLKNIVLSFFVIIYSNVKAQDVDATITVIHPKIQISNTQIFSSLQASISQFLNQRLWSTDKITNAERFKMSILIDVTA